MSAANLLPFDWSANKKENALLAGSCSISLVGTATSIIFVVTKHVCCCNKSMSQQIHFVAASILLSQRKMCFAATNMCLSTCRDKNYTCGSSCQ